MWSMTDPTMPEPVGLRVAVLGGTKGLGGAASEHLGDPVLL